MPSLNYYLRFAIIEIGEMKPVHGTAAKYLREQSRLSSAGKRDQIRGIEVRILHSGMLLARLECHVKCSASMFVSGI